MLLMALEKVGGSGVEPKGVEPTTDTSRCKPIVRSKKAIKVLEVSALFVSLATLAVIRPARTTDPDVHERWTDVR